MPEGFDLVVTTDGVIAGVHFFFDDAPADVARKALRMNLSDLAAKGAKPLGFDLAAMRDSGKLIISQLDAAELSPGEFAYNVRAAVQDPDVRTVVIDSLNGYQAAMPEEHFLLLHMHELVQYLNRRGVSTFITMAQHGLVGDMKSPVDVTYLADTVILGREHREHQLARFVFLVWKSIQIFRRRLLRTVDCVVGDVHEKRLFVMPIDE